jgi:hypothetical protein
MSKFVDQARNMPGIHITSTVESAPFTVTSTASGISGVFAWSLGSNGIGVIGRADSGPLAFGVWGISGSGFGVVGNGGDQARGGVFGESLGDGYGVLGVTANGTGVAGVSNSPSGYAGYFDGNVTITGTCTGCLGPDRIDHPLDPGHKYLYHAAVESPDMMNVYNGNITLDAHGVAIVVMPDYFEAFNRDFRYQLTAIGAPGPNLYVAEEIQGNRFKISGGKPNTKVSWQVTGIRHDSYSEQNAIQVETEKPTAEQGKYLHPEAYGQPETNGISYQQFHSNNPMPVFTPGQLPEGSKR